MTARTFPWLDPAPPWTEPVPASLCAGLPLAPGDVPIVEVLSAPLSLAEVVAVRAHRYVPMYGAGPLRSEAVRLLAMLTRALAANADPRGPEHALTMCTHPGTGRLPLLTLCEHVLDGRAPVAFSEALLGYAMVLGASDLQRERLAQDLAGPRSLAVDIALTLGAGGGDYGTYREHYSTLAASHENDAPAVRVVRAWFDFVLARRFSGLDTLRALAELPTLDLASRWLLAVAEHAAGDDRARTRATQLAEQMLEPVRNLVPRLASIVAREMAEMLRHPFALRMHHLRCAVGRDHAAVAIRAWLSAATETDTDEAMHDTAAPTLGPEPTRAGRAAIEARNAAGEFLLDWFVNDRDAREPVDAFARRTLRTYHRLRGALLLARAEEVLRPTDDTPRTGFERMVWGAGS